MTEVLENLSLLFERPLEPTYYLKDNGKKIIELPENFKTEQSKNVIIERSSFTKPVTIKTIELPNISFADGLKKFEAFSLFLPKHQEIATKLTQLFLDQPNVDTLLAVAVYCRDRINVFLFQYSFSVAIQHRPDTRLLKYFPISLLI